MWEFDEFGNPRPKMWPENDPVAMNSMAGNPQADVAPPPEPPPPAPAPAPAMTNNQWTLEDAYGIKTRGPMADQATQTAQDYTPPQAPQQFGQEQNVPLTEGPLSPQETAEAMPTNRNAMDELIKKHMLGPKGGLPQASRDGYENYVTASREKRAAEKDQLANRAQQNRAATREKSDNAWDQTLKLNQLQGAGPLAQGGGSSFGGGGRVSNIGGYTFVKGTWRPQTPEESAKTDLIRAQADYMRQRPEIAREGYDVRRELGDQRNATQVETTGMRTRAQQGTAEANREQKGEQFETKQGAVASKQAQELRREFDNLVGQLKEREGIASEQTTANTPGAIRSMFGAKAPEWKSFLDDTRDSRNKGKYVRQAGSYDTMAQRMLMLAKQLETMHDSGVDVGMMPDDLIDYVESLRMTYPSK